MNPTQYGNLTNLLGQILDRMPEKPATRGHVLADGTTLTAPAPAVKPPPLPDDTQKGMKAAQAHALYAMLVNLDGWIQGAQENHEALGHRYEPVGDECWRSFAPDDIRRMVNDTASELGLDDFPIPGRGHGQEDHPEWGLAVGGGRANKSAVKAYDTAHLRTGTRQAALRELHGEAIVENVSRVAVAAAGKSWTTHMMKFSGAVVPRRAR